MLVLRAISHPEFLIFLKTPEGLVFFVLAPLLCFFVPWLLGGLFSWTNPFDDAPRFSDVYHDMRQESIAPYDGAGWVFFDQA